MAEQTLIRTATEVPVFFKGGDEDLFGILTVPNGRARGIGVVAVTGGGYIAATNRNRLSVRLAAKLAALGYHVFRFDYNGIGESTGETKRFVLHKPFVQDLEAAVSVMRGAGLRRVACVGGCYGSRVILVGAEKIPELEAAVLMSAPVREFRFGDHQSMKVARDKSLGALARLALRRQTLRALLSPADAESKIWTRHMYKRTIALKARLMLDRVLRPGRAIDAGRTAENPDARDPNASASPHFVRAFTSVVDRGISVLMLYGQGEPFYEEFTRVRNRELRPVFERARAPLDVQALDRPLRGFTTIAVQDAAIERTVAWLERIFRA